MKTVDSQGLRLNVWDIGGVLPTECVLYCECGSPYRSEED